MNTNVFDGVLYYPIPGSFREEVLRAEVWTDAGSEARCRSNTRFRDWNETERRCCIWRTSNPTALLSYLGEYDISHFAPPFSIEVEFRE